MCISPVKWNRTRAYSTNRAITGFFVTKYFKHGRNTHIGIIPLSSPSVHNPMSLLWIILFVPEMSAAPEEYVPQRPKYQNPLVDRYGESPFYIL